MIARVRHLAEPSVGDELGRIDAPRMPIIVSTAAIDTSRSISPAPMQDGSAAPGNPLELA